MVIAAMKYHLPCGLHLFFSSDCSNSHLPWHTSETQREFWWTAAFGNVTHLRCIHLFCNNLKIQWTSVNLIFDIQLHAQGDLFSSNLELARACVPDLWASTGRWDRQSDRQTDRQAERQADIQQADREGRNLDDNDYSRLTDIFQDNQGKRMSLCLHPGFYWS